MKHGWGREWLGGIQAKRKGAGSKGKDVPPEVFAFFQKSYPWQGTSRAWGAGLRRQGPVRGHCAGGGVWYAAVSTSHDSTFGLGCD